MGAAQYLLGHGLGDGGVGMAQQQRTVARDIINVFIAVYVPLAGTFPVSHEQGEGSGVTRIVGDTARKDSDAFLVAPGRARVPGDVVL